MIGRNLISALIVSTITLVFIVQLPKVLLNYQIESEFKTFISSQPDSASARNVLQELEASFREEGVDHAHIFLLQVLHETAGLTSAIYKECNNLCGMKYNSRGFAIGTCRGHAMYARKLDSVKDYASWQKGRYNYLLRTHRSIPKVGEEYYKFLQDMGYAEDKNYIFALKTWDRLISEYYNT